MTYRGHVKNRQITLDEPSALPEGAAVNVEVVENGVRITRPQSRARLRRIEPLKMPGGSLADELIRERR
jgi:hypothetical protein